MAMLLCAMVQISLGPFISFPHLGNSNLDQLQHEVFVCKHMTRCVGCEAYVIYSPVRLGVQCISLCILFG